MTERRSVHDDTGGGVHVPVDALRDRSRSLVKRGTVRLLAPLEKIVANHAANLYRELEALAGIYATLRIERPLPPMRGWAISPDFGRELTNAILDVRPEVVLELGSGVSTLIAAYSVKKNGCGRVISVDHDRDWLERSTRLVESHGLEECVTLVHANLAPVVVNGEEWTWYDLEAVQLPSDIEILVVDGPPITVGSLARYPALPLLVPHLAAQAVVMLDDADRPDERQIVSRWLAEFPVFDVARRETEKGCAILRHARHA